MSEQAVKTSVLYRDSAVLQNLGLKVAVDDDYQSFPNSKNGEKNIVNLVKDGANFEDDDRRPLNHFYDPAHPDRSGARGRPLTAGVELGRKSPDWALEQPAEIAEQEFSLKDAGDYLYRALTLPSLQERKQYFGRTFETLGHIIHHLQDMAQPQHVRNDAHCDQLVCAFGPRSDA